MEGKVSHNILVQQIQIPLLAVCQFLAVFKSYLACVVNCINNKLCVSGEHNMCVAGEYNMCVAGEYNKLCVSGEYNMCVWQEVRKRFPDGLPLLDPIEDMGIKDKGLKEVIRVSEGAPSLHMHHGQQSRTWGPPIVGTFLKIIFVLPRCYTLAVNLAIAAIANENVVI